MPPLITRHYTARPAEARRFAGVPAERVIPGHGDHPLPPPGQAAFVLQLDGVPRSWRLCVGDGRGVVAKIEGSCGCGGALLRPGSLVYTLYEWTEVMAEHQD